MSQVTEESVSLISTLAVSLSSLGNAVSKFNDAGAQAGTLNAIEASACAIAFAIAGLLPAPEQEEGPTDANPGE